MDSVQNYFALKKEIESLAQSSFYADPKALQLVCVSKSIPESLIYELYVSGCRDFGESRVQELMRKKDLLPKDIRWHMIGSLQSNKVGKIIDQVFLIHSVDSWALAQKIAVKSLEQRTRTAVLLEVKTSWEANKKGWSPAELKERFSSLCQLRGLEIKGLMTMAPFTEDLNLIRKSFSSLRILRDELRELENDEEILPHLSMGMSHDYGIAIEEGATFLRIGSAIFK